jgi:hypothetical protein
MIFVMNSLLFLFCLALITSCGKSVKDKTLDEIQEESIPDGTYSAVLIPMNSVVSTHVSGDVKVKKYGDDFRVEVKLKGSPGGVHKQYLQTGSTCKDIGSKLVPFDDDLSGQIRGLNQFPSGNYHYKRSTSYYLMLSDLHLPDDVSAEELVKLREWDLPLEKRAVSVYAKTSSGELLMACGVLTRISTDENDDNWNETPPPRRNPDRVEPRPRPRPTPRPVPVPDVDEDNHPRQPSSWWDRIRQGWRRWRDRISGRESHP